MGIIVTPVYLSGESRVLQIVARAYVRCFSHLGNIWQCPEITPDGAYHTLGVVPGIKRGLAV